MIEEHWEDDFIYYVTFIGEYYDFKFTRALIFNNEKSSKEIEQAVLSNFKNVREVTVIDGVDSVLILKEEFRIS